MPGILMGNHGRDQICLEHSCREGVCQPNPFSNLLASLLMHRDKNSHREMTPEGEVAHIRSMVFPQHYSRCHGMGEHKCWPQPCTPNGTPMIPCAYTAEKGPVWLSSLFSRSAPNFVCLEGHEEVEVQHPSPECLPK